MRIVIDIQGAQTSGSRFRGIGRYTLALAQGIARLRNQNEVIIAVSDAFPESIPQLRSAFSAVLPAPNFRVWQGLKGVNALDDANRGRRSAAELVREAFLASLRPDVIVIASLFEGLGDDAVSSIGVLHEIPTAVVLYDLIPYIHRQTYLAPNPVVEAWYEERLSQLRRADLLLSISHSSADEAQNYLGFAPEQVVSIGTAADSQFHQQNSSADTLASVCARHGLTRPFVMYTGGIDHRKNIDGLISAFALLPAPLRKAYQLAVVCKADEAAKHHLQTLARQEGLVDDTLVLTGFVPEDDLIALYHACTVFVFPSWHEGFGLPALEAMACGAPVIASNTSSLPEVVGLQEALFDPLDVNAIAAKILQVLTDDSFRERLVAHGLQQAATFSWDITAQHALNALEKLHARSPWSARETAPRAPRPRLAYVSPLPPEQSGISDYSAELLPELARFYDIELIVDQSTVEPEWMRKLFPVRSPEWLRANRVHIDRVLYHFGNSAFHQHMFDLLRDVPGVVTLHDFFLSGVTWWMEHAAGRTGHFAQTLYSSHGYAAVEQRFRQEDINSVIWEFPSNAQVLNDAVNIIVHGPSSLRLGKRWYGAESVQDWSVIPHLRVPVFRLDRIQARRRMEIPENATVVCSFGFLHHTKRNRNLLDAWLNSEHARDPNAYLVFVGESHGDDYGRALTDTIRRSPAAKRIRITGWAETADYRNYLAATDIAVQLRTLSRGETSGTVLDCMNYGLATIVNAHGSMADLADDAVWKLPDEFSTDDLVQALNTLKRDADLRDLLGARARERILTMHSPRICAEQYRDAIETAYRKAEASTLGAVAAIGRMEATLSEADLLGTAACLAQNRPRNLENQLLIDVTELIVPRATHEFQRIARTLISELLRSAPVGFRVEPVYSTKGAADYRYARRWVMDFLSTSADGFADALVEAHQDDILLTLRPDMTLILESVFYKKCITIGMVIVTVNYKDVISVPQIAPDQEIIGEELARFDVMAPEGGGDYVSQEFMRRLHLLIQSLPDKDRARLQITWNN